MSILQKNLTLNNLLYRAVELKAPGIIERSSVCQAVITGILAIDSIIPIDRGQSVITAGCFYFAPAKGYTNIILKILAHDT